MKKPAKNSGVKFPGSQILLAQMAEAEKILELARKKAHLAKVAFKHSRKAFKQARKAAKQARKLAKVAIKAANSRSQRPRKKAKPAPARKPKIVAPQVLPAAPANP